MAIPVSEFNLWRSILTNLIHPYSMLEAQIILFELVRNFKFYPDPDGRIVRKRMQMAMVPVIEKQDKMLLAMPLKVERIQD